MNFSGHTFCKEVDLSGLILVRTNFDKAKFKSKVILGEKTRFYDQSSFRRSDIREEPILFQNAIRGGCFFIGSRFKEETYFMNTEFMGTASFANVVFEGMVNFNAIQDSRRCVGPETCREWSLLISEKPNSCL